MTITSSEFSASQLSRLRATVQGAVLTAADPGYPAAVSSWNLNAIHRPAVAVVPVDVDDLRTAVRWAGDAGLGVGVQATGHGTGQPCDGGLLLNTSQLQHLQLDPDRLRAGVGAGVLWRDVVSRAAAYGLAGLPGSSTTVGVVGSSLGGGFGWLGRRFGLAAHAVRAADLVTADGRLRTISRDHHGDLFWAVPGGLSSLGVVTRLELALQPVPTVYAGNLYHRHERLPELLQFFAEWTPTVSDDLTAAVTIRRFPPASTVPEPLRGRVLVSLRGAYSGDVRQGAQLIDEARAALGPAELDSFTSMPAARLAEVSADPVDPLPARSHHELLAALTPEAVDDLVALAGADSGWPLVMTEVRQLGGALGGPADLLHPMARTRAGYSLNAIGVTAGTVQEAVVRAHLATLARRMAPHATGDTYLNFLDLDGATPERVRAAFTPADRSRLSTLKSHYDPADVFRFGRRLTTQEI